MRRSGGALSRGLDREVHAAVTKYLDNTGSSPQHASVEAVYAYLKRSNSSLGRKSKVLLEDCITRILDVMRGEAEALESDEGGSPHEQPNRAQEDASDAMNRRLTAGWNLPGSDSNRKRSNANGNSAEQLPKDDAAPQEKRPVKRTAKRVKFSATVKEIPNLAPEPRVKLEDIGGMDKQIERLKYLLWLPFRMPHRYQRQNLAIPRGVLLHGPPGCGKTMLCEAFAHLLKVPFISISAPSVVSGMSGESEKAIREHFDKAVQVAPSLIFIDEIDAITPKRESAQREMERRIVSQLLTCMDDLAPEKTGGKPVMVLAATNRPNSLDSALRRAGRFDTEIEIGVPDAKAREAVLRRMTGEMNLAEDVDISRLARLTPGFVGADLASLVREAVEPMQRRFVDAWQQLTNDKYAQESTATGEGVNDEKDVIMHDSNDQAERHESPAKQTPGSIIDHAESSAPLSTPGSQLVAMDALYASDPTLADSISLTTDITTMSDFVSAVSKVQASSTREGFATIPDVPWSTVGAYHETRATLQKTIVGPIANPELYARFNQTPPGVLMHGPPGCGKTLLAKAVASASRANFISVKGPELLNKYVGESEKAVRQLFQRARYSQPVIVFFDELDALVPRRDDAKSEASNRVVNAMLAELDGVNPREEVYVIGATNRRDAIDPAVLRPGRLGKSIYVGLPGGEERVEIFAAIMAGKPVRDAERDAIHRFARGCEQFSGADLQNLAYEAGMEAIDRCAADEVHGEDERYIEVGDVQRAMMRIKPSVVEE